MPLPKNQRKYIVDNPNLINKWDYEKNNINGLDPSKITEGSHWNADFICPKCGNKWNGIIRHFKNTKYCEECIRKESQFSRRKKEIESKGSLYDLYPEIAKEWDYMENDKLNINPKTVLPSSNFNVTWICPKCGEKYKTYIGNRTKGTGCPYCAGQKVMAGINDLATTRPDLLKEWDYERNDKIGLKPQEVMRGTHVIANWICPVGHEYQKEIKLRTSGQGCTICAQESQTSFPEQALYFYLSKSFKNVKNRYGNPEIDIFIPELNFGIEYDGLFSHKNKEKKDELKSKILKDKGVYLLRIKEVNKILKPDSDSIIYCIPSNYNHMGEVLRKVFLIIKNKYRVNIKSDINLERDRILIEELYVKSLKQNSIVIKYPEIAREWDYEKNGKIKPEFIPYGSSKKYWWKCKNHSYLASPKHRVHGTKCPYCALKELLIGVNDIKSLYPEVIKDWDYKLNNKLPEESIAVLSHCFYWKCEKGHSYKATLRAKINNKKCTICSGKEILIGYNDLKTIRPDLAEEWDYDLNERNPEEYTASSNKKANWVCKNCGNKWKAIISNRSNCPKCSEMKSNVNVYDFNNGNLIGEYKNVTEMCNNLNINKNIKSIYSYCRQGNKAYKNRFVIRYKSEDEFINYNDFQRMKAFNKL